jgi:ribonuclease P protein component
VAAGTSRFSADRRLKSGSEFDRVFASAERSSDRYFTILARLNDLGRPRLGLAISKRVAKRAVDRNRLKRLVREVFRTQTGLRAKDYVVLARAAAKEADRAVLRTSLVQLFTRAGGQ